MSQPDESYAVAVVKRAFLRLWIEEAATNLRRYAAQLERRQAGSDEPAEVAELQAERQVVARLLEQTPRVG